MVMDRFVYGEYEHPIPRAFEMTIIAQDPSVWDPTTHDHSRRVLRATVRVPADKLEPGPRSHRFHVVDYDASASALSPPTDFTDGRLPGEYDPRWKYWDRFREAKDGELLEDFAFHAQNTYAIAARTLATFEAALGRRLPWAFGNHQLYLVPHAFAEANAYYADDDHAIYFGYFQGRDGERIYTCLSHDIIAHETTHAVLDGLRPHFDVPGLPDQAAFHEALADMVALLSVFSVSNVVERLLSARVQDGRIPAEQVEPEHLRGTALLGLAEEMGDAVHATRGSALRRSVEFKPSVSWRSDPSFEEPHRRGEILVSAVAQTLLKIWGGRLKALMSPQGLDLERAAEEGAKSAEHLLKMIIRSIDYCPPLELEFEDFIDALLVSDAEMVPDDDRGYRKALKEAFQEFDILPPRGKIIDLSRSGLQPLYQNLNFTALQSSPDEVFRFIWENAELLEIDRKYWTYVDDVRPSVRVSPDGFVVRETIADYLQAMNGTAGDFRKMGFNIPVGLHDDTQLQAWGGGTLIFDQFGQAKYHQTKPIGDWDRQYRRLDYLVRNGLADTEGRYGYSLGTPRGQRFTQLHRPEDFRAGEDW
jgi:hypothetical protein